MIEFADDVGIVFTAETPKELEIVVMDSLERTRWWLSSHKQQIAVVKTKAMTIANRRAFTPPTIRLEG